MFLGLFTICLISGMYGSEAVGGQCKISERSAPGKALKGHTFKEFAVRAIVECQNTCERDSRCASYNFYIPGKVCELNSHTKEERPDDFVTDELRFYMRREDDDECLKTPLVCDVNANCKNTLGSYLCSCKEGFIGDGKTCQDVDECQISTHNCSDNATCINTEGSFNCSCKLGYSGNGYNCSDVDECQISTHNCSNNATCINTEGSFNCSCKPGYRGNGYNCSDVDECQISTHNCSNKGTCINTEGSFNCSCKLGYSGNGYNCSDVDECQISTHNCSNNATCINTEGSFNCSCKPGYSGNGYNCSDVDECHISTHNCSDNASCINTEGSFNCSCKPGYRGNGYNCSDIDECARRTHNCHSSLASCTNTAGSFSCTCNSPYSGDGRTCNLPSECQNYQSLTDADRKITYETYHGYCDNSITKGWYRFEGAAGTRLPTSCTPSGNRCGAHATSWLTNGHPSVDDGRVSKQVCFSYYGTCCYGETKNINVRNCGNYYVYELVPTGSCSYRYCGTD